MVKQNIVSLHIMTVNFSCFTILQPKSLFSYWVP